MSNPIPLTVMSLGIGQASSETASPNKGTKKKVCVRTQ